jgi:hypothetical protein
MGTEAILARLDATKHPPNLKLELEIESEHPTDRKKIRLLSRYQRAGNKIELDLMSRLLDGNPHPFRFLIEQRIDLDAASYKTSMWAVLPPDPYKVRFFPFVPWESLPSTELKNFDFVLPFPYDATLLDPSTSPHPGSPGVAPPPGCTVIDLHLKTPTNDVGSDRMRLWIADDGASALDLRVEHYRGANLLRVVFADAAQRSTVNVHNGRKTVMTATTKADLTPIPHDQFMSVNLTSNTW